MIKLVENGDEPVRWVEYKEALKTSGLYEIGTGSDDVFARSILVVESGSAACFVGDGGVYNDKELKSSDYNHWRFRRLPKGASRTFKFTQED